MTPPTNRLSTFFKDADTQFGVFYPRHYLLALFATLPEADRAKQELNNAGRLDEDVISASGDEVVRFAHDHLLKDGFWGMLMTEISRTIGTEAAYAEKDLTAAKKGAAFVAVLCPNEKVKTDAWKCIEPRRPFAARYYGAGGIEHLAGEI